MMKPSDSSNFIVELLISLARQGSGTTTAANFDLSMPSYIELCNDVYHGQHCGTGNSNYGCITPIKTMLQLGVPHKATLVQVPRGAAKS